MGKRIEDGNFGEENIDLNKLGLGKISSCRELYTPLRTFGLSMRLGGLGAPGTTGSVVTKQVSPRLG